MSVGNLCSHNVVTISPTASIAEAALSMRQHHIGDLVVVERHGGRLEPVGIVTDRDLVVEVLAQEVAPEKLTVADVMSRDLLVVNQDNGIEHTLLEMDRAGVRRAPVVDADGELIGVLSIDDAIDYLARLSGHIAATIRTERSVEKRVRP